MLIKCFSGLKINIAEFDHNLFFDYSTIHIFLLYSSVFSLSRVLIFLFC